MIVQCKKCGKRYELDRSHLKKGSIKVRCPNCKYVWVIKAETREVDTKHKVKRQTRYAQQMEPIGIVIPKLLPIDDIIIMRALIGHFGEKNQFGWWDTNFLSDTGLKFLSLIFPRTALSAAVNSVTEAAKQLHDSRIGKGGVYHLFRMPEFVERKIHNRLLDFDSSVLLPLLTDKDTALEKLKTMTDSSIETSEGPIQAGNGRNLLQLSSLKKVAKQYAQAFEIGKQIFPYFTGS